MCIHKYMCIYVYICINIYVCVGCIKDISGWYVRNYGKLVCSRIA